MARKPTYETPEALEDAADKYFAKCDIDEKFYTVAGLAYCLGFQNRKALSQIKSKKPEFAYVIDRTKLKMEQQKNELLLRGGNKTAIAGIIFDLKNNFNWKDMQEKDITIHGTIQAMTDEQLDEKLKLALKELIQEIGIEGIKQLGFDGESKPEQEGEQEDAG